MDIGFQRMMESKINALLYFPPSQFLARPDAQALADWVYGRLQGLYQFPPNMPYESREKVERELRALILEKCKERLLIQ